MKLTWLLPLIILGGIPSSTRADACDGYVYLRRVGSALDSRFELLKERPRFESRDIVRVPAQSVDHLEEARFETGTVYVVRTGPSILGDRFEVRTRSRGVGYLQSIGGGAGGRRCSSLVPFALSPPRPQRISDCARDSRSTAHPATFSRPFGWPPYDNPLERRPHR